ncbi:MAG: PPC domain-containing protein [Pseudomonadota bacterium]|nr:PPC domain-containing protein [Pseudomonadota bacterium]
MHRSMLVVLSLFVSACGPRQEDTGPEGETDTPDGPECAEDADCGSGSICEAEVCVDGDRNDDIDGAEMLLWDNVTEGEINPAGDVDWYSVTADGGEFVRISVVTAEAEGGIDSVVSVYNSAGKRVVWEDEHPAGNVSTADSMCFGYFPEPGTYYIKVEDTTTFYESRPVGGPDEDYTLEIAEWNSVGVEPDSAQDAGLDFGLVSTNTLYSFPVLLDEAGEYDWAHLDLPAAGAPIYVVALQTGDESELVASVTMRNQAGDDVIAIEDPTTAAPAMLPNPEGTSYVIGATDAAGGGGADYWTWLFFVVRDIGSGNTPGQEPDDTLETANVLELTDEEPSSGELYSGYRQGRIDTESDADLYAFDATFDDAYVSVYLGAQPYGSLLVPRIEILDASGAVLDTVDSSAGVDTDALDLGPYATGSYFLRVSATPESGAVGGEGYFYLFGLFTSSSPMD